MAKSTTNIATASQTLRRFFLPVCFFIPWPHPQRTSRLSFSITLKSVYGTAMSNLPV
jgi:hypothetical protein